MKKQIQQLSAAVVVLATWLPLPAAAEMRGTATCANPSWSSLASGECGIADLHIVRQPQQGEDESSTALVVGGFTPNVPEPETYALMLVGLTGIIVAVRRRRVDRVA